MHTPVKSKASFSLMLATLVLCPIAFAETASDNSKANKYIEENKQLTSQDQGSSTSDVNITKSIRQHIVKQDDFSSDAKNVKIITNRGVVVLKGPVKNASEKKRIEDIAVQIAGSNRVNSAITISK